MSEERTAPELSRLFAARLEKEGMGRTDIVLDTVKMPDREAPALFLRASLCPTYEAARLMVERAITAARWSFSKAAGYGALVTDPRYSRTPEYIVSELEGGLVEAWINAISIRESAAEFERIKATALHAAEEYREAVSRGVWPTVSWQIQHPGRRPSYKLQSLIPDPNDPILTLLGRLGIE